MQCNTWHDRDANAANNILAAGRLSEAINGRVQMRHSNSCRSGCKTSVEAVRVETPTTYKQLSLF